MNVFASRVVLVSSTSDCRKSSSLLGCHIPGRPPTALSHTRTRTHAHKPALQRQAGVGRDVAEDGRVRPVDSDSVFVARARRHLPYHHVPHRRQVPAQPTPPRLSTPAR